ncbi:uncharacterized protein LOC144867321 [Branchiostoma floridae x Branchiostoma japonicum]
METEQQGFPEVVCLNVGGRHFTTSLSTLRKREDSMLAAMFSGRHHVATDKDGRYFIDRDGTNFGHILNFLRSDDLPPTDVAASIVPEAEFYGIHNLVEEIFNKMPNLFAQHVLKRERTKYAYEYPKVLDMMREIASKARQRIEESCSKRAFATFRKKSTLTEVVVLISDAKSAEIPPEVLDRKSHDCMAEKACDLTICIDDVGTADTFRHFVLTEFTRVEHVGLHRQCSYKVCFGSECFDIVSPRSLFGPRWLTPQEHGEQCACATREIRCWATLLTFRFNWDK